MSRRFISAVLAVSMSITAIVPLTASPVAADTTRLDKRNDDAAKLIAGAAAIAILGAAIANKAKQDEKREKDRKKDKDRREAEKHKPRYEQPRHEQPRRGIQLSQRCIVDQRGRNDAYDANCLARQGVQLRDLPGQCRVALNTRHGNALGFDARCIDRFSNHGRDRQSGWQQNERYSATPYLPRRYPGN
ncbi:hypothetical protein Q4543_12450 [Salipiger sp. 1_MG-2023]|uniref:hypothetical protein n=1 Tax=Salipiger sp. 1_MG-2023 TaxID=3062665 RepID=UPI0026E14144|nr:hypothetical protein [Salipiger sp. 1_MG-2023]MDO6586324.1 hypothetical protein [Salipiger sp. 1_MG-2023]